jgi:hypothetical protein
MSTFVRGVRHIQFLLSIDFQSKGRWSYRSGVMVRALIFEAIQRTKLITTFEEICGAKVRPFAVDTDAAASLGSVGIAASS